MGFGVGAEIGYKGHLESAVRSPVSREFTLGFTTLNSADTV
jgi:hypothetical protein